MNRTFQLFLLACPLSLSTACSSAAGDSTSVDDPATSAAAQDIQGKGVTVFPPQSRPAGHSYSEWAAAWWIWAMTAPPATNPVNDTTGQFCDYGQKGPVWFLAGSFSDQPVHRTCAIPSDKFVLFPILNIAYGAFATDPPEQQTPAYVRSQVTCVEQASILEASVDGQSIPHLDRYLEKSVLFKVNLPPDNIFGVGAVTLWPTADEGYYVMLPPLSPGKHSIHIRSNSDLCGGGVLDVTYALTVGHDRK